MTERDSGRNPDSLLQKSGKFFGMLALHLFTEPYMIRQMLIEEIRDEERRIAEQESQANKPFETKTAGSS